MPPTAVSPKVASRALGVSESTLKRWCDRDLLQVTRTVGGHRKVAVNDVLRLARRQGRGLAAPELLGLPARGTLASGDASQDAHRLAAALLAGQQELVRQIIFDLLARQDSLSELFDNVIAAAFATIGDRWACREADVYQERRACAIVQRTLSELRVTQVPTRGLAMGATLEGDHYSLASKMAELVLRDCGIDATALGTSIPAESCVRAVQTHKPQIFWLSASHVADETQFLEGFARLSAACHELGVAIVVGGRSLTPELRTAMVYSAFCDTMQQLERFATTFQGGMTSIATPAE
jgi:methanogenic corrinoid protein MtbC1